MKCINCNACKNSVCLLGEDNTCLKSNDLGCKRRSAEKIEKELATVLLNNSKKETKEVNIHAKIVKSNNWRKLHKKPLLRHRTMAIL